MARFRSLGACWVLLVTAAFWLHSADGELKVAPHHLIDKRADPVPPPVTAEHTGGLLPVVGNNGSGLNYGENDDIDPRCTNVDIRNRLDRLRQIENCTVISGFFQMVLIEHVPSSEFAKYKFKNLREVTGYMLFFRVIHLVSLRDLFPNLMVIRGQQLIGNYALVFYYMSNMIEVGLKNLVAIQRGFVYSLHCPLLCHLDTIDWATISGLGNGTKNLNSFEPPKTVCNKSEVCRGCVPKYCWGSQSCQKFYKGTNFNGKIKCHTQCIGGCTGTKASDCLVCRGWKEGKLCVEECTVDKLLFRHTKRCITKDECLRRNGLLYMNECVLECPPGFSSTNVDLQLADFSSPQCYPCHNRCPKVCDGTEIMYLSDADRIRGCTIINGTLHIRLKEDHPNLLEELRNGLGDIEEIMGVLKVFRSNYISSLEFLASLEIIHGLYTADDANFSLMVYENSNLQRLWNFEHKTSLRLLSRGMYFRNNELLCNSHIKLLRRIAEYDNTSDTIDWGSNGYMQACHVQHFPARVEVLSSHNATVYWTKHKVSTQHRLQGYQIYFIRTTVDKSPYEDRDTCSKFGWKSRFVSLENIVTQGSWYAYNLTRLKPFTRYGCYVKAYYNETFNHASDIVGLSEMYYFKTAMDRPTPPLRVRTARKNDTAITMAWQILASEQEMVTQYHVDVFIQPDDPAELDRRNYCVHPHETPQAHSSDASDEFDGTCTRESCCELEMLEEEEEMDEDDGQNEEVTAPDEFLNEYTTMEDGGRIGGRKKRLVSERLTTPPSSGEFERTMLQLLKSFDEGAGSGPANRFRRYTAEDDEEEVEFVNRIFYSGFKTDNFEYTVTGLKPYTRYIFQLFACGVSDVLYCSSYSLYTDRTDPSTFGDRLNVTTIDGNDTTDEAANVVEATAVDRIMLQFPEPIEVNALTVAYRVEIESLNGTSAKWYRECFTRLEHERRNFRYTVHRLGPGDYMVRAKAISLAGPGPFTEWMLLRVLEPLPVVQPDAGRVALRNGLIAFGVILLLAGVAGGAAYAVYRRRQRQSKPDDRVPLAVNDGNQVNLDDGFVTCPLK
ncbi:insulin-like peptide receptor [Anopheles nili]|uniref:insulin-like peptide receptor n=1 Tax=Anopheles nili TaxID=185578 RepID=UPI00237AF9BD|nr:insulin-like peptide receptor [Anopheles nili]